MAEVLSATDADFEEKVLRSSTPVLVDFYGSWCAPCVKMKPMLAEIASELAGRLSVVEVEVADAPETAGRYGVMGVPTLVLIAGGEPKETLTGSPGKAEILRTVEPHLAG